MADADGREVDGAWVTLLLDVVEILLLLVELDLVLKCLLLVIVAELVLIDLGSHPCQLVLVLSLPNMRRWQDLDLVLDAGNLRVSFAQQSLQLLEQFFFLL